MSGCGGFAAVAERKNCLNFNRFRIRNVLCAKDIFKDGERSSENTNEKDTFKNSGGFAVCRACPRALFLCDGRERGVGQFSGFRRSNTGRF